MAAVQSLNQHYSIFGTVVLDFRKIVNNSNFGTMQSKNFGGRAKFIFAFRFYGSNDYIIKVEM
jgi:hypothetical protein